MDSQIFKNVVVLGLLSLALGGCGARVKSYPYDETLSNNSSSQKIKLKDHTAKGFVYGLPKTRFELKGTCALYRILTYDQRGGDVAKAIYVANLDNGVEVLTKGEIDQKVRFRVDPGPLRNWRVWTEGAKFTVSENGVLTDVNVIFNDQTAEIIESTAKTAINVGKTAALAMASVESDSLLEKVADFEVIGKFDPDLCPPKSSTIVNIFSNMSVLAQSAVMANIAKDELRDKLDAKNITLIVNEVKMTVDRSTNIRPTSKDEKETLGKDNLGDALIRFVSFEKLKRNYVNGIVSRIPGFVHVKIESTPLFVIGKPSEPTVAIQVRNVGLYRQQLETVTDAVQRAAIQANIKTEIDSMEDRVKDLARSQVLFDGSVPVSQFGKLAVIPITSNTFVKQGKTMTINKDTGAVNTFDFNATSSGQRAAKMLENVSESVVKEIPALVEALSGKKGAKSEE